MPLVTLDRISVAYGHLPLLHEASFRIEPRERVAVIGRNGTGKSTLLRIVSGEVTPQKGAIWREPALRIGRLAQDGLVAAERRAFDVVAEGMQHADADGWSADQKVSMALSRLQIPADVTMNALSGGWRRRVLLARALVGDPDLLLLDEPTNHLDIDTMRWLEASLADYAGTVMFVTHDRVFLQALATRIVELDRGRLTSWPGDYATFLRRKRKRLRPKRRTTRNSTSVLRRRRSGCARASRRGGRETRVGCARF
jgi:ATP-binding cassette subfamily F protein uup